MNGRLRFKAAATFAICGAHDAAPHKGMGRTIC